LFEEAQQISASPGSTYLVVDWPKDDHQEKRCGLPSGWGEAQSYRCSMNESGPGPVVTEQAIVEGLCALGLDKSSVVIVHSSLRSFGYVEGGALTGCRALVDVCGTVFRPAFSWDLTGVPAPPGRERPQNAACVASSWEEFDAAVARAVPFTVDLPIDREIGLIPETFRRALPHRRSTHPLLSFIVAGPLAEDLVAAQRLDWCLGPIEALAQLGGDVLLLGVSHASNTAIHLAEQRLGRSCFYRYAKADRGVWMELPNISGCSDSFDAIEPEVVRVTRQVRIGTCRARRLSVRTILAVVERLIRADPGALLCQGDRCRCPAALQQRLAWLAAEQ
jgi:aminoglycoside 3-N-acetyltransferase